MEQKENLSISCLDDVKKQLMKMAQYHLDHYDKAGTYEYSKDMASLYDEASKIVINLSEKERDAIVQLLEDFPRKSGGYNFPISLDMMFRSDGHGFSKLFKMVKTDCLAPFSLKISQAFVNTALKFAQTNEFKGITTLYLCSDEITGLSRHGTESINERDGTLSYIGGAHPFGGKRDKVTSMISATLTANFAPFMEMATSHELFDKVCEKRKSLPTFDARAFPVNRGVVGLMVQSRLLSCYRNTVSELHDYFFGTKAGHGLDCKEKRRRMLEKFDFDFNNDCPAFLKFGVFVKGNRAYVPSKIPALDSTFVEFLYAKESDYALTNEEFHKKIVQDFSKNCEIIPFEEVMAMYPNGYISEKVKEGKRAKYESDMAIQLEQSRLNAEKSKQIIKPSREETIRARAEKKLRRAEKQQGREIKLN